MPDRFLDSLVHSLRRRRRELVLVAGDPTRLFLAGRGPEWYRRQGVTLQVLHPIDLRAITVNPVAPRSHAFDSAVLRAMHEEAIPEMPVFDVMHADYRNVEPTSQQRVDSRATRPRGQSETRLA